VRDVDVADVMLASPPCLDGEVSCFPRGGGGCCCLLFGEIAILEGFDLRFGDAIASGGNLEACCCCCCCTGTAVCGGGAAA